MLTTDGYMKKGQKTQKKLEFRLKNNKNRQKVGLKSCFWALIRTNRDESAFLGRRAGRRVSIQIGTVRTRSGRLASMLVASLRLGAWWPWVACYHPATTWFLEEMWYWLGTNFAHIWVTFLFLFSVEQTHNYMQTISADSLCRVSSVQCWIGGTEAGHKNLYPIWMLKGL